MHPLLESRRRLGLYLAAWAPIAGLLAYLLAAGGLGGGAAAALAAPLCLFYAFVLLPVWYSCRVLPLDRLGPTLAAQLAAAGVAGAVWMGAARLAALALGAYFPRLPARLGPALPIILGAGILLYLLAVAGFYLLIASAASRRAETLAREAELRALRAQVNPHFLFNSLNSISALTGSDPARAREMCVLLGDFLRRTLGLSEKPAIPLGEELALARAFLAVEKIRFGERIAMREMIGPGASAALVPPLLLQPLVENAVVHGMAHLLEGGWIEVRVARQNGQVRITVENNYDPAAPGARRGGVGLNNVRGRLAARYGSAARLEVAAADGRYRVAITLPAEAAG